MLAFFTWKIAASCYQLGVGANINTPQNDIAQKMKRTPNAAKVVKRKGPAPAPARITTAPEKSARKEVMNELCRNRGISLRTHQHGEAHRRGEYSPLQEHQEDSKDLFKSNP